MIRSFITTFLFFLASLAQAHPEEGAVEEGLRTVEAANGVSRSEVGNGISLPKVAGPKPWSDKPLLNTPGRFQIAIVTDRTGGHRPGVWMDAVEKLNQLRPEFVVSVGDLIEGYTEDEALVQSQWEEFTGFIDKMQMRFFFVAGNHDLTNPMMHRIWRERFGPEWYSFDYRGVHFLCLNSEDPRQRISDEQLRFIEEDLEKAKDARWTLVFLHKPLWTYAESALKSNGHDPTNWKRVEKLLVDRPHTVFSGHVHHYVQYERNGRHYYSLATTGGGSRLRGADYGEFDHITWLTMEDDGPHTVNLRLDGILPADVVTEEHAERFRNFLEDVIVSVEPIWLDDDSGFTEGEVTFRLENNLGAMVKVVGDIEGLPYAGLTIEPSEVKLSVGPTGSAEQTVRVAFAEPVEVDRLRRVTVTTQIEATGYDGIESLRAESVVPVVIDRRYRLPSVGESVLIDGKVRPLPDDHFRTGEAPLVVGRSGDWQGPTDGSFAWTAAVDDERLVLSAHVIDDRVLPGEDALTVVIDGRPHLAQMSDPRLRRGTAVIEVPAPTPGGAQVLEAGPGWRTRPIRGVDAAGRQTDNGYELEIAIPLRLVTNSQGSEWEGFRLTAVQTDRDESGREAAEIIWHGSPDYRQTNVGFAYFSRNE